MVEKARDSKWISHGSATERFFVSVIYDTKHHLEGNLELLNDQQLRFAVEGGQKGLLSRIA